MASIDVNHPPAGGFQNGGWYWDPALGQARQYWNGSFGAPSTIANPNQTGFGQRVGLSGSSQQDAFQVQENPADSFIKSILGEVTKPLQEAQERAKKFDESNPFVFDEILARQSAEERLSPYYDAELNDYLSGVERARGKTLQDEATLKKELDTTTELTTGRLRKNIDETIRNTQEGFAATGLLSSGQREREVGKQAVEGEEDLSTFLNQQQANREKVQRGVQSNLAELAAGEATYRRRQGAERETSLTTDVQEQRRDQEQKREFERQQFIGYPLASGTSSLSSIFGLT